METKRGQRAHKESRPPSENLPLFIRLLLLALREPVSTRAAVDAAMDVTREIMRTHHHVEPERYTS